MGLLALSRRVCVWGGYVFRKDRRDGVCKVSSLRIRALWAPCPTVGLDFLAHDGELALHALTVPLDAVKQPLCVAVLDKLRELLGVMLHRSDVTAIDVTSGERHFSCRVLLLLITEASAYREEQLRCEFCVVDKGRDRTQRVDVGLNDCAVLAIVVDVGAAHGGHDAREVDVLDARSDVDRVGAQHLRPLWQRKDGFAEFAREGLMLWRREVSHHRVKLLGLMEEEIEERVLVFHTRWQLQPLCRRGGADRARRLVHDVVESEACTGKQCGDHVLAQPSLFLQHALRSEDTRALCLDRGVRIECISTADLGCGRHLLGCGGAIRRERDATALSFRHSSLCRGPSFKRKPPSSQIRDPCFSRCVEASLENTDGQQSVLKRTQEM
eukprot:SAG11_NODE_16_length_26235_cov_39.900417_23_plen_383_part_00